MLNLWLSFGISFCVKFWIFGSFELWFWFEYGMLIEVFYLRLCSVLKVWVLVWVLIWFFLIFDFRNDFLTLNLQVRFGWVTFKIIFWYRFVFWLDLYFEFWGWICILSLCFDLNLSFNFGCSWIWFWILGNSLCLFLNLSLVLGLFLDLDLDFRSSLIWKLSLIWI